MKRKAPLADLAPVMADPPAGRLLAAAAGGHLEGSLLLVGESGIGKRRFAFELARRWNCPQKGVCAPCDICRRIVAGQHPDVGAVRRQKADLSVDEARAEVVAAMSRPYEGKKRVTILDDAEAMSDEAANAFLKILEEPPSHQVFVLVSSRPERILATIRSRCATTFFPTLAPEIARRHLLDWGFDAKDAELAVRLVGGRLGAARAGLHEKLEPWRRRLLDAWLDPASFSIHAEELAEAEPFEEVMALAATLARDVAVADDPDARLVHADLADDLRRAAAVWPRPAALELGRRLLDVPGRLGTNPNLKLLFEDLFLAARGA